MMVVLIGFLVLLGVGVGVIVLAVARSAAKGTACSACGRTSAEVGRLVAGRGVFICDGCVPQASLALSGRGGDDWARVAAPCAFCGAAGADAVQRGALVICGGCLEKSRGALGLDAG